MKLRIRNRLLVRLVEKLPFLEEVDDPNAPRTREELDRLMKLPIPLTMTEDEYRKRDKDLMNWHHIQLTPKEHKAFMAKRSELNNKYWSQPDVIAERQRQYAEADAAIARYMKLNPTPTASLTKEQRLALETQAKAKRSKRGIRT